MRVFAARVNAASNASSSRARAARHADMSQGLILASTATQPLRRLHSICLMRASLAILAYFATSSRKKAANAAGGLPTGS